MTFVLNKDPTVGSQHCILQIQEEELQLFVLSQDAKVKLNGVSAPAFVQVTLNNNDEIQFGPSLNLIR